MSEQNTSDDALDPRARDALKAVFITLFLDLVGFSIIFPLFPSMLTYYLEREGGQALVGAIVGALERFTAVAGGPSEIGIVILFGGVLGSLYSLLQFVCTPFIGVLSDRFGRKPVLMVSIAGIIVSYAIWFVAGSFSLLVLSRILGGIMSGNISTASAVVADVTSVRNRSKGMAIIGMAFGLGFVVGPAIGGFSAMVDLTEHFPSLVSYGVNPFSVPAFIAFILSVANLVFVATRFHETLSESSKSEGRIERSISLVKLFKVDQYPGVTRTSMANFLFITAFSGMEFSLTFLAMDRLDYSARDNAFIFLFVGFIIAGVQGGYVRRRSPIIGPRRMSVHGFIMLIPGLVLIGLAQSSALLFLGLFFMAAGSAQVIPCLTGLASSYAPAHDQGRVLGVFRSLGALARGIGPLIMCVLYWRLGSGPAYFLGAASIVAPMYLAAGLPAPQETE